MARKKTESELVEDIRRLEERLNAAKEKKRQLSKAEEAKQNAAIIKAVRDEWSALPEQDRPSWEDMPAFIYGIFRKGDETVREEEQTDQERMP